MSQEKLAIEFLPEKSSDASIYGDFEEDLVMKTLFSIPQGVQLVIIKDGKTTAPTSPSGLEIIQVFYENSEKQDHIETETFLRVGLWLYPLIPGQTPVLQNEHGIFVFPSLPSDQDLDMSIGIILPRDQPDLEHQFVEILKDYAVIRLSSAAQESLPSHQKVNMSQKIATFLLTNGQKLAIKIENGSNRASSYITNKGENYRNKCHPKEEPSKVSPTMQKCVNGVHKGAKQVAKGVNFALEKIGQVTGKVGNKVGTKLYKAAQGDKIHQRGLRNTLTVAGGGVASLGMIFMSLEKASRTLFKSIATETVECTRTKYGDEAADTTQHALHATGHTAMAGFGIIQFAPKMLVQRCVMQAGMECIVEGAGYNQGRQEKNPNAASSLIPVPQTTPTAPLVEHKEKNA